MSPKVPTCVNQHGGHPHRAGFTLPPAPQLDLTARMFAAMADPERLRLLVQLSAGERCVTELVDPESQKLTTVSARLKLLHSVNLVKRRREGQHIFYSLADEHVMELLQSGLDHVAERIQPVT